MKEFFLGNWGNLASVIGLLFSFLAFWFSKRASTAARQARDLAQSRSVAQDMNNLDRSARDLIGDIDKEKGDRARERARDMLSDLRYLCARWVKLLSYDSKNNLMSAREIVASVHERLVSECAAGITQQNKPELITSALRASEIFSEEHGTAEMTSDFAGEPTKEPSWIQRKLTQFYKKP